MNRILAKRKFGWIPDSIRPYQKCSEKCSGSIGQYYVWPRHSIPYTKTKGNTIVSVLHGIRIGGTWYSQIPHH